MSIFGPKNETLIKRDIPVDSSELRDDIEKKLIKFRKQFNDNVTAVFSELQTEVRDLKIEKSHIITIFAESKGSLLENELFSFGNGGKENGVGYVMMRRGKILGISLSSKRIGGEVEVGVSVNDNILHGCDITLRTTTRKNINFKIPFIVEEGDLINFVSRIGNATTKNTVVSLLIELN